MRKLLSAIGRFLTELRRRKVYQVALAYLAAGFVVVELADIAAGTFDLPGWFGPMVWVVVGLGFPIALVLAWALEVTPEGVRVEEIAREETEGSETVAAPASTTRDLWIGASVLVLLLLGAWWLFGGLGPAETTTEPKEEIRDRSIAVLPFEVSGAGAEEWRDGMVTTLTLNLDGAAGLRAIPDRRIFAAVEQIDSTQGEMGGSPALAVARRLGAEYALVGTAVQLGGDLRLGAEVYGVASGERLGQVEAEGPPENITALTDELTRKLLGVLLERSEEAIPSVNLESITTSSLDALKDFLQAERHYRANEYEAAADDYEAAVAKDSTFALAYARLQKTRFWSGQYEGVVPAINKAFELSSRLPERERRLVRARHLWVPQDRGLAAVDSLRRLSRDYPEDPTVWYNFGEVLYHNRVPRGLPEAEGAFRKAIELDPGVPLYHHHHVELAFVLHHDSSLAAKRIEALPEGPRKQAYRLAFALIFGSDAERSEALARVDSIPAQAVKQLFNALNHPTDGDLRASVLPRLARRDLSYSLPGVSSTFYARAHSASDIRRGRVEAARAHLQKWELEPTFSSCLLAQSASLGIPAADSPLQARLESPDIEEDGSARQLMCRGIYLLAKDRSEEVPALIKRLRATGIKQEMRETEIKRLIDEVKGYRAFRAGRLGRAKMLWDRSSELGQEGAILRGDLYRKLGGLKKAEGWYLGAWRHPLAHERLGQLYEETGKPKKAQAAYDRFIGAWAEADEELQSRVEKARQRLRTLTDSLADTTAATAE